MHLLGNVLVFYVYKKKCFASPDFSYIFMTERIMDSIYQKKKKMLSVCSWRLQWNHRYAFYFTCVQV